MARPDVSAFTARWYGRLPAYVRRDDAALDYPLLRSLSLLGDQAGEVEATFDAIDRREPDEGGPVDDTSDLGDPATAPSSWLPWLAMLAGLDVDRAPASFLRLLGDVEPLYPTLADLAAVGTLGDVNEALTSNVGGALDEAGLRAAIASGGNRWAGSKRAIREFVEAFLTGTKIVQVRPHKAGNVNVTEVATFAHQTPEPWRLEAALAAAPIVAAAGARIDYSLKVGGDLADVKAGFATLADVDAAFPTLADLAVYVP